MVEGRWGRRRGGGEAVEREEGEATILI